MPRMNSATNLLTTEQVAARVGKSVSTVNRWAKAGRITPAFELPGKTGDRLYDPAVVDDLAVMQGGQNDSSGS